MASMHSEVSQIWLVSSAVSASPMQSLESLFSTVSPWLFLAMTQSLPMYAQLSVQWNIQGDFYALFREFSLSSCVCVFSLFLSGTECTNISHLSNPELHSLPHQLSEIIVLCLCYPFLRHSLEAASRQKTEGDYGAGILCFPFFRITFLFGLLSKVWKLPFQFYVCLEQEE